jgi:hypothetical protein
MVRRTRKRGGVLVSELGAQSVLERQKRERKQELQDIVNRSPKSVSPNQSPVVKNLVVAPTAPGQNAGRGKSSRRRRYTRRRK